MQCSLFSDGQPRPHSGLWRWTLTPHAPCRCECTLSESEGQCVLHRPSWQSDLTYLMWKVNNCSAFLESLLEHVPVFHVICLLFCWGTSILTWVIVVLHGRAWLAGAASLIQTQVVFCCWTSEWWLSLFLCCQICSYMFLIVRWRENPSCQLITTWW